jgi:aspartyl-tRNA(Asn)/glutamyl-tRNA(Gln) amidotransferase subunit A
MSATAVAIAADVRAGKADAAAICRAALDACIASQPRLNALTGIDAEKAMAEAKAVAARVAKEGREAPLPLAGVPIVVKDNIWVGGWRITQGSRLFADHVAPRDALCVERARRAGAVVVAIGHCPEFACKGLTRSPLYGLTRHPMDETLTPGGSSGGNVAIVAEGAVPVSIGTDAGGSSRRPPAHCGLVGFKPSQGAIPHPFGFEEPFWGFTMIAPIARDVADTKLLFDAMAGPDPRDPESLIALIHRSEAASALKVAFHPALGLDVPVDPDVREAFARAIDALGAAGLKLSLAAPAWPSAAERASLGALQFAGLAAIHGDAYRERPDDFDPDVAVQIEKGFTLAATDMAVALETSQRIRRTLGLFFGDFDIMLSPTTPCVAWPHDVLGPPMIDGHPVDPRGHAVFTPLFNHGRNPAISIPCGRGRGGLPVGLQIAGAFGEDDRVLRFAAEAERILAEAGLWNGLS